MLSAKSPQGISRKPVGRHPRRFPSPPDSRREFSYGRGTDEPICLIDVAGANARYFYHCDGLGSVVALSDMNSVLVERYTYDIFGRPTIRDANGLEIAESAFSNPYLFTGRAYDAENPACTITGPATRTTPPAAFCNPIRRATWMV
jgi:hypothetical protein